ncbi:LysR family transcriptional regulator [Roseibium marinum]
MLPKLRKLHVALSVAESGSFSGAARHINMTQPAVTRAVQSLEDELGILLFHRSSRTLALTDAGKLLVDRVRRTQHHLKRSETELRALNRNAPAEEHSFVQHASDHEFAALLGIADFGSINSAARAAGLTQPAMSKSLRTLENRVGTALFYRMKTTMKLTRSGEVLLRRVKLAQAEIRQAVEEIGYLRGETGGRIRIGALPLTLGGLVPVAVEKLLCSFPDAQVAIVDGTYEALLRDLAEGNIDILAGTIRQPIPIGGLESEELFRDDIAIIAARNHPLAARDHVGLADCLDHGWVLPFGGVPIRALFESALSAAGLPSPRNVIETDSVVTVRSLLLRGDRLALLSRFQVDLEVDWRVLKILSVEISSGNRPVGITIRSDFSPTPMASALLGSLRAVAAELSGTRPVSPNKAQI